MNNNTLDDLLSRVGVTPNTTDVPDREELAQQVEAILNALPPDPASTADAITGSVADHFMESQGSGGSEADAPNPGR